MMKCYIPHIAVAAISLTVGFLAGGLLNSPQAVSSAAASSNTGSLFWLTTVSNHISGGKVDEAKDTLNAAINAHISVIEQASNHPYNGIVYAVPWQREYLSSGQTKGIQLIKKSLLSSNVDLSSNSQAYLATIPNVAEE